MGERRTELLEREKHMMMRESQLTFHIEAILNCRGGKLPEEQSYNDPYESRMWKPKAAHYLDH